MNKALSLNLDFSDKVVLVTGSSRGIGLAIAEGFAARGAAVVINGRNQKNLDKAESFLKSKGYAVFAVHADVGNYKEASMMIQAIVERFGRIDVVVNNAGIIKRGVAAIEELSDSDWDVILSTNLKGAFNVCKNALPIMKKNHAGVIINIGSQTAAYGSSCAIAYPASKGGIVSLTKSLAREAGKWGIRVNSVAPGLIKTEMTAWAGTEQGAAEYTKIIKTQTPLRRIGMPSEIASACLFLASQMASYITGQTIAVNGGRPFLAFM